MSSADELRRAIDVSGLSRRGFADLLAVDERTMRRWVNEAIDVPGPVRVIAAAIIRNPALVAELAPPSEAVTFSGEIRMTSSLTVSDALGIARPVKVRPR